MSTDNTARGAADENALIVVTGGTSNTGSAVARALLGSGARVRVIGRHRGRLEPLVGLGAEAVVSEPDDEKGLRAAFEGAAAAFLMLAPGLIPDSHDFPGYQRRVIDAQVAAIGSARTGPLHRVVTLSGWAANHPEAPGPVRGLRRLEQAVAATGVPVVHLRPGWFMENALPLIDEIRAVGHTGGILPPDLPLPMIATADIGVKAAQLLSDAGTFVPGSVELQGPADRTLAEVTRLIGSAVGVPSARYAERSVRDVRASLVSAGFTPHMADGVVAMTQDVARGRIRMRGPRTAETSTPTTFEEFLASAAGIRPAESPQAPGR